MDPNVGFEPRMPEASSSSSPVADPSANQADMKKPEHFSGHLYSILAICYSPDGKRIVTGGKNPLIRIWDSDTGEMVFEIDEHKENEATSMCFSRNTSDGQLVVECVEAPSRINTVAYSPDSQWIASGGDDGRVRIWHSGDMVQMREITGHPEQVRSISFSPNGCHLATGCDDHKIRIFDIVSGSLIIGPVEGHTDGVCTVNYSPDGEQLASGSRDCTIRTWDVSTGRALLGPLERHFDFVTCILHSPDGRKLLSCSSDKTICLWDSDTGELIGGPVKGHHLGVKAVTFALDGVDV